MPLQNMPLWHAYDFEMEHQKNSNFMETLWLNSPYLSEARSSKRDLIVI